jgi:hypothetical protein
MQHMIPQAMHNWGAAARPAGNVEPLGCVSVRNCESEQHCRADPTTWVRKREVPMTPNQPKMNRSGVTYTFVMDENGTILAQRVDKKSPLIIINAGECAELCRVHNRIELRKAKMRQTTRPRQV